MQQNPQQHQMKYRNKCTFKQHQREYGTKQFQKHQDLLYLFFFSDFPIIELI